MNHLKKAAAVILAALIVSTNSVVGYAADFDKGDLNLDGVVDSNDAVLTLQASVDPEMLSVDSYYLADINSDGIVDADDAVLILRLSLAFSDYVEDHSDRHFGHHNNDYEYDDNDDYNDYDDYYYDDYDDNEDEYEDDYEDYSYESESYESKGTQVADMEGWSSAAIVEAVGPLFTEDQRKTGILASVSMAQFIIESGYGQSGLSINANNCFGIKGEPEAYRRSDDSPWDGVSVYSVSTKEYDYYGNAYYTYANFRKYDCMEDSIADHSRILITSEGDYGPRYQGIVGCTNYREAARIIYYGGYATDPGYVDLICSVIEYWDLTQYDL